MRKAFLIASAAALALASSLATIAVAQTPAAPEFKRLADGHPDFSGAWSLRAPAGTRTADPRGICVGFNCGPTPAPAAAGGTPVTGGTLPAARPAAFPNYKPEFKDKVAKLNKEQVKFDPALRCGNPGIPRVGPPDKIMQNGKEIVFLYEDLNGGFWRIIPTDGRAHRDDAEEGPFGDSVGHWEGDKLVIETIGFNDETWLTDNGAFHTGDMKTVEELTVNGGKLDYKFTVNDPGALVEPWVKQASLNANKDPMQPVPCVELSIGKMTGIESYHPNARW